MVRMVDSGDSNIIMMAEKEEKPGRASREIEHGRKLAATDTEVIWGWGTPAGIRRAHRRADLLAAGAGLGPGVRALEIGCGTGLFTEMLAATGAGIVAVDISEELLDKAPAPRPGPRPDSVHWRPFRKSGPVWSF